MSIDHIEPWSKFGSGGIENLRWVDPEANTAKGALFDDDFLALCRDVVRWRGL